MRTGRSADSSGSESGSQSSDLDRFTKSASHANAEWNCKKGVFTRMSSIPLLDRIQGRYIRDTARFFFRRPAEFKTQIPFISFTFDDFPRSALLTGGAILKHFGLAGTYYASFGLMGKQAPAGPIFLPEDLKVLQEQGHELGCHTFDHYDSWKTDPVVYENSILKNRLSLNEFIPGGSFKTFSYPINPPRARTKRRVGRLFLCSRGGGQTFNVGTIPRR